MGGLHDRFWTLFCDRLESEVRALGDRDLRVRDDDKRKAEVRHRAPNTKANQSLRNER
jgi:hypothetical protein